MLALQVANVQLRLETAPESTHADEQQREYRASCGISTRVQREGMMEWEEREQIKEQAERCCAETKATLVQRDTNHFTGPH